MAFIASIPLIRLFSEHLTKKSCIYMIILHICFEGIIPLINSFLGDYKVIINGNFSFAWCTTNIIFYPCIGYYIANKWEKNKHDIFKINVLAIIGVLLATFFTYLRAKNIGVLNSSSQSFHNSFVHLLAIAIFTNMKGLSDVYNKLGNNIKTFISKVAGVTFGIYLLHVAFLARNHWTDKVWDFMHNSGVNYMILSFVVVGSIMLCTGLITMILKKIPLINRLL